ncbi:hypothetical protein [Cytobacillus oceanisediminis]|uniref:hypothetical protein n=1 Tax=Cytobacillus oceanisediminis TaxID=665099 RepID=UPI002079524C|nr:hypothetical protein [Cytobacillus oceanisediminis]USK44120.1 hypothetical protein LIT27_26750 [Cytobacillus oceanisediminis]
MRDPRRIKRILTLLEKIWEYQPDIRFNQLVSNLQSLYSQQHDNYGTREMLKKEYIHLEKTSYLDFFFLEDDKWEKFLSSYLSSIEITLEQRREKIDDKVIDEVIELLIEAGIKREHLDAKFRCRLNEFFLIESKWLSVKAIVVTVKNFNEVERMELYTKILML